MNYGYIYKITYLNEKSHLYNHYYYGMRVYKENENLFDDNNKYYYHGSSTRAGREYWPYYNEHKKEIICWCNNINELRQKESEIISIHINEPLCINCQIGGSGNPFEGKSEDFIKDVKLRISETLKQTYKEHPELLENMSVVRKGKETWMKGKHHSKESRKKLSKSHKGKSTWSKGKSFSDLHKQHLSESRKKSDCGKRTGCKWSEEAKERNKGVHKWMTDNYIEVLLHNKYWGEYIDIGFRFGRL